MKADLHVMPNNGAHEASIDCWCEPRVDDGQPAAKGRVWIHDDTPRYPADWRHLVSAE